MTNVTQKSIFSLILALIYSITFSQSNFIVKGSLLEKKSNTAIEYGTVSLYNQKDSTLINGTISDLVGKFSINTKTAGLFYLKASYIGMETIFVPNISISKEKPVFVTENIYLSAGATTIKGVEVIGEKTTIRYEIDKKIISVGKDIASSNGSAVDVLETVPSINVDLDGNVKLRGSSDFTVLVNGKPTILSSREVLQQTPAGNIKNIELITNPSAKYEAGNTAGIINIILKEEKKIGTSGMLRLSVGTFKNHNASFNLKHNIKKFSLNFTANTYQYNSPYNTIDSLRTTLGQEIITNTDNKKTWTFPGYSFGYGMDYNVNKNHTLNFNFVVGKWAMNVLGDQDVRVRNKTLGTDESFTFENDQKRFSDYYGPSLSYNGSFKNKSNLSMSFIFGEKVFKEKVFNTRTSLNNDVLYKDKSTEIGFRRNISAKIDYTLPIKTGKIEFGGMLRAAWNDQYNNSFAYDLSSQKYSRSDFNNRNVLFEQKVYGLYATYGNKWKKFSYSAGFRAEYLDRNIIIKKENKIYAYYKWNYFPSASLGYKISEKSSIHLSYSRRIRRQPSYFLEPSPIKTGTNSYFQGNPNLQPKLINALELGWSNTFKKSTTLSVEAFYKLTTNEYRFISIFYKDSVSTLHQPNNVGKSQNIGLEANLSFKPIKWLSVDLMGTGYLNTLKGKYKNIVFNNTNFDYAFRMNTNFTVTKTTKIQFNGNYRSKRLSALGNSSDDLTFGLGVKQSFLKKALNFTFNIQNVFYTSQYKYENSFENFYASGESIIVWPRLTVGASYKINNFRQSRNATANSGRGDF